MVALLLILSSVAWAQETTVLVTAFGKQYAMPCRMMDGLTCVDVCGWRMREILLQFGATSGFEAGVLTVTRGDQSCTWGAAEQRPVGDVHAGILAVDNCVWVPIVALPTLLPCRIAGSPNVEIDPLITDIRLVPDRSEFALHVESSAPVHMQTLVLKAPDRFVVDIPGAALDLEHFGTTRAIDHPDLGQIRFSQFSTAPLAVRIVIPLQNDLEVEPLPQSTAQHLIMALRRGDVRTVGQNFDTQKITSVRAEQDDHGLTLDLKVTGPVQFSWHRLRPPDNRIFVDVPDAVLTTPRQTIPASDGWTNAVTVSQFQITPRPIVRIVFEMARPAAFDIKAVGANHDDVRLAVRNERVGMTEDTLSGVKVTALPSRGATVVIDAGHGGSDAGAINPRTGLAEKNVTLDISLRLAAMMKKAGWNVFLTRDRDRDVSWAGSSNVEELQARCKIANDVKADLFISIHCNASVNPASFGTSVHWYKNTDLLLARTLLARLVRDCGCTSRGCQFNHFYVLRHTTMPAVLVETGFITNAREAKLLASETYRALQAQAFFEGAKAYLARTAGRRPMRLARVHGRAGQFRRSPNS
jgi:N-acetylmuramoyl-L-alanine amidase